MPDYVTNSDGSPRPERPPELAAAMSNFEIEALHSRYCRTIGVEPQRIGVTIEVPHAEYAEMVRLAALADEADAEYARVCKALGWEQEA